MNFQPLTIKDREFICSIQRKHKDLALSLADFNTTFLWSAAENVLYSFEDGILYIINNHLNRTIFLPPFPSEEGIDLTDAVQKIDDYCQSKKVELLIRGITPYHIERISGDFLKNYNVIYDRNSCEYIYLIEDLIKLKREKSLRDKANKILHFENENIFNFRECTCKDYDNIIELFARWKSNKSTSSASEFRAICKMLEYRKELEMKCGIIEINGKVAAFSAGSVMYNGHAQILFEKADACYNGIYQAINKYMLEYFFADLTYVNRQEDMGIEGLRRAKKSYCPEIIQDFYCLKRRDLVV